MTKVRFKGNYIPTVNVSSQPYKFAYDERKQIVCDVPDFKHVSILLSCGMYELAKDIAEPTPEDVAAAIQQAKEDDAERFERTTNLVSLVLTDDEWGTYKKLIDDGLDPDSCVRQAVIRTANSFMMGEAPPAPAPAPALGIVPDKPNPPAKPDTNKTEDGGSEEEPKPESEPEPENEAPADPDEESGSEEPEAEAPETEAKPENATEPAEPADPPAPKKRGRKPKAKSAAESGQSEG